MQVDRLATSLAFRGRHLTEKEVCSFKPAGSPLASIPDQHPNVGVEGESLDPDRNLTTSVSVRMETNPVDVLQTRLIPNGTMIQIATD
jgi:hypothetical protein